MACESQNPFPYQQGIPEVAYLKLTKSSATNSTWVIANGVNYVELQIQAFNKTDSKLPSYDSKLHVIEGQINGTTFHLKHPFRFSTTKKGTYSFRLKANNIPVRGADIQMTAIEPEQFQPTALPVIFHYFNHKAKLMSNLEKDSVAASLSKLLGLTNKDFGNKSGSTDPNRNDTGIRLELAIKGTHGSSLKWAGVNFVETGGISFESMDDFEDYAWKNCFWPPKKYVNVWVAVAPYFDPSLNGFSWAYFPTFTDGGSSAYPPGLYGVMLHQNSVGSSLLSHEIGHMLNLLHVFGDCASDNDGCADTWSYARSVFDSPNKFSLERTSCSMEKFVSNNLMDYGPTWNNTFTLQQSLRIQDTLLKCAFLPTRRNGYSRGRFSEGPDSPKEVRVSDKRSVVP